MEYILRKAAASDAARICGLFIEMLQAIYGEEHPGGYRDGDLDPYFAGGEDRICVAEASETVVGFLAIEVHREEENYLYYDDFCVSRDYRGRGIGSALMHEAEEYCRQLGFSHMVLHVEKSNHSAYSFYTKRGFTVLREEETRLCLVKTLSADKP